MKTVLCPHSILPHHPAGFGGTISVSASVSVRSPRLSRPVSCGSTCSAQILVESEYAEVRRVQHVQHLQPSVQQVQAVVEVLAEVAVPLQEAYSYKASQRYLLLSVLS